MRNRALAVRIPEIAGERCPATLHTAPVGAKGHVDFTIILAEIPDCPGTKRGFQTGRSPAAGQNFASLFPVCAVNPASCLVLLFWLHFAVRRKGRYSPLSPTFACFPGL